MRRDAVKKIYSSFLSNEKDTEMIIRKLFVDHPDQADALKRLLLINMPDCLDNKTNKIYQKTLENTSVQKICDEGYFRIVPKIPQPEHSELKNYIILSYSNFTPNQTNPLFRDCTISFDIVCNTDCWNLGDYRLRPIKIAGIIDGLINEQHLSGIGTINFLSFDPIYLTNEFSGFSLSYRAVHGSDDIIPPKV